MGSYTEKYNINESTWTYKGFHGVLHTFFPVGQSGFPMKKFFGDCSSVTLFFVENDYTHWYWNDNDLTRLREKFFERVKKDPDYLSKLQNEWDEKLKKFDLIIDEVEGTMLGELTDEKLISLYDKFYKSYIEEFSYFMVLGDAVSMHADRYLIPSFKETLGDDFTNIFPKLITTTHTSFLEKEAKDREKLTESLKKTGKIKKELLEEHSAKYFYIENNYAKAKKLTANDFLELIKEDAGQSLKISEKEEKKKKEALALEREKLIEKYNLSSWQKTLLNIMDEFFGIQDDRKKYVLISNYYQYEFLKEASRRGGIPFNLLRYSVYPEYREVVSGSLEEAELEDRQKFCMCVQTEEGYEVVTGNEARSVYESLEEDSGKSEEIKGTVAAKGWAKGRVKRILKIHDMINMEEGDVLVSSMTRPEMVPAMKKAAAIVTDEGGITSHAAIVSRELGIPCIIGTKIATKVLKDGDLVEVDANEGIIKVLEKN